MPSISFFITQQVSFLSEFDNSKELQFEQGVLIIELASFLLQDGQIMRR